MTAEEEPRLATQDMADDTPSEELMAIADNLSSIIPEERVNPLDRGVTSMGVAKRLIEKKKKDLLKSEIDKAKKKKKSESSKERIEILEAIEKEVTSDMPTSVEGVVERAKKEGRPATVKDINRAIRLQGTSRPEMQKLLDSLNINMSIQLSKNDTANLLACLLTCNETQLSALLNNKRVPVAIKTVINRLLRDMGDGEMGTIESIWSRLYGNGPMKMDALENSQFVNGIIPNTPVSREAYLIIRENMLK